MGSECQPQGCRAYTPNIAEQLVCPRTRSEQNIAWAEASRLSAGQKTGRLETIRGRLTSMKFTNLLLSAGAA